MVRKTIVLLVGCLLGSGAVAAAAHPRHLHRVAAHSGQRHSAHTTKARRSARAHSPRHHLHRGYPRRAAIAVARAKGEQLGRDDPALFSSPPPHESGGRIVYFEYGIAEATAGISADGRRTLIKKINLVATGPRSVDKEVQSYLRACAEQSTILAAGAAYGTPSPEPAARLAAAYATFKGAMYQCLSGSRLAKTYFAKFAVEIVQRDKWVDGLVLRYNAENTSAKAYALLYGEMAKRAPPGPLKSLANAFYRLNVAEADLTKVNIDMHAGDPVGEVNKWVPISPEAQTQAFEKGLREASRTGIKLLSAVMPPTQAAVQVAQHYAGALGDAAGNAVSNAGRSVGDAANNAGKAVGDAAQNTGKAVGDTAHKAVNALGQGADEARKRLGL